MEFVYSNPNMHIGEFWIRSVKIKFRQRGSRRVIVPICLSEELQIAFITQHAGVYARIKTPSPAATKLHKMLWEL